MWSVLGRSPFFVCIHPWKLQHARFSVTTFIVIIGCFSFCIQTRRIAQKKFLVTLNVLMTVELSSLIRSETIFGNWKSFKNDEIISCQKLVSISRYLSFLSWLFGNVAKHLDKRDKVNFKIYDVTTWLTNNCNTHIVQYFET